MESAAGYAAPSRTPDRASWRRTCRASSSRSSLAGAAVPAWASRSCSGWSRSSAPVSWRPTGPRAGPSLSWTFRLSDPAVGAGALPDRLGSPDHAIGGFLGRLHEGDLEREPGRVGLQHREAVAAGRPPALTTRPLESPQVPARAPGHEEVDAALGLQRL